MSNKTTRGKTTQPKGGAKVEETVQKMVSASEQKPEKHIVPRDIDPHMIVTVRNGFQGSLVYVSKKTGERFVWDGFGDEQDMEIGELRNARNSSKSFFINNWFMFDEPWIVDYLGLTQYYRFAVGVNDFDAIFDLPIDEMIDTVSAMSDGQKRSVAYRARVKIRDGEIDSNKKISALEKCLNTSLIERD